jgi:hypothetical protein
VGRFGFICSERLHLAQSGGDDDTERVEPEELFGRMRLRINEDARVEHALRI